MPTIRYAVIAALALGTGRVAPVFSQTTPNWGAGATQTGSVSPSATKLSPWGGTSAAAPATPTRSGAPLGKVSRAATKVEPIPPALAEILKRPDTDTVTLPSGQSATVKDIRAEINSRQAIITALKTASVPAGKKQVLRATARSQNYDALVNASSLVKDTARREASAAWAAPGATSQTMAGKGDPAAAWAAPASTAEVRSNLQTAHSTGVGGPMVLHSGVGTSTLAKSGSDATRWAKPSATAVSQQPAVAFIAQNLPPGIALVNGHSTAVQFTPGGLYTVIGTSFGSAAGTVDLVGTHLPGGRLALQVTQWRDGQLQAQLPEPMSGIADEPVTLRVTTRAGTIFTMNVQFYATRQPLTLSGSDLELGQAFDLSFGNANDWGASTLDDEVIRTKSGSNINCPSIGQDTLRTKLPPGWATVEVSVSSWLPTQGDPKKDFYGHDGDTVVSGSYDITQIPAGLTNQTYNVRWGVLRSHSTDGPRLVPQFTGNDFGWSGDDGCVSAYNVALTVVGPAGLRPY